MTLGKWQCSRGEPRPASPPQPPTSFETSWYACFREEQQLLALSERPEAREEEEEEADGMSAPPGARPGALLPGPAPAHGAQSLQ